MKKNGNTSEIVNITGTNAVENTENQNSETNSDENQEEIDFTKYTKVAIYNELELHINNKNNDEIEWYSNSSHLYDTNNSDKICTEESPCTGESVIFIAGETLETNTISITNKTLNESISYTVTILKPHEDSFSIKTEKSEEQIEKDQFFLQEEINFISDTDFTSLIWEFSFDGGLNWERSSENGIISAGKFIPKKSGLASVKTTLFEAIAEMGSENLKFTKHEISSQIDALRIDEAQINIDSAGT
jgi:hypothetical protein